LIATPPDGAGPASAYCGRHRRAAIASACGEIAPRYRGQFLAGLELTEDWSYIERALQSSRPRGCRRRAAGRFSGLVTAPVIFLFNATKMSASEFDSASKRIGQVYANLGWIPNSSWTEPRMPKYVRSNRPAERAAVNAVTDFFERNYCIVQSISGENDIGKDAYVDLTEGVRVTGVVIAVQVKGWRPGSPGGRLRCSVLCR
jgi:hypothetical protein